MQSPDSFVQIKLDIPHSLYIQLLAKSHGSGQKLSDLAIQGLEHILRSPDIACDRLDQIEMSLENKLKEYIDLKFDQLLPERHLLTESAIENVAAVTPTDTEHPMGTQPLPLPTIRPLQVGDRVLILEPESPYYMAKLLVIRTSLIRATVETETGEKTFLKRDLRFIEGLCGSDR